MYIMDIVTVAGLGSKDAETADSPADKMADLKSELLLSLAGIAKMLLPSIILAVVGYYVF